MLARPQTKMAANKRKILYKAVCILQQCIKVQQEKSAFILRRLLAWKKYMFNTIVTYVQFYIQTCICPLLLTCWWLATIDAISARSRQSVRATKLNNFFVPPSRNLQQERCSRVAWLTQLPIRIEVLWTVSAYNKTRTTKETKPPLCTRQFNRTRKRCANGAVRHYKKEIWCIYC